MRLPIIDDDAGQIDYPEATRMLRYAIDHGVNYVDTAYVYHKQNSEKFLGQALQDGYRERVKVATKMPCYYVEKADDFDRYFEEQLERLQNDRIEIYLLHALSKRHWPRMRELGILDWAERALADGRIERFGFSFHDSFDLFKQIVDSYDQWTVCQIQYNYMDIDYQAGTRGLLYAAQKGLAVVVMGPIRGGMLASRPPQSIAELWDGAPVRRSPAEWALQFVWNRPEVPVVLSGMSTMEHVVENVANASRSDPGSLTDEELALIAQVREKYRELAPIPCTNCEYCLPCPQGVRIPYIFAQFNDAIMYDNLIRPRFNYGWLGEGERADSCIECGDCQELCPQSIAIIEWLAKAHQMLAPLAPE